MMRVDKSKKGLTKRLTEPIIDSSLTPTEQEVLRLVTDEFLSLKQIQLRRKCSRQAVYKILKKLRKKGILTLSNEKVDKTGGTYIPKGKIRLHGQEFNIRILWQNQFYQKRLRKSNILFLDGNTIKLYRNSIEFYSGQSFISKNEQEADSRSLDYLRIFLRRLENDLKVILIKNRVGNIREVKHEYARTDSEVYQNAKDHKERIFVYAEEDGKLCFITDSSWGFKEDETVHTETAKSDRKAIDKQINDWRLNNPPTTSELALTINKAMENLPPILVDLRKQISSHLKLIQAYRKENVSWRKSKVKEIKKELKYGRQTTLGNFLWGEIKK